MITDTDTRLLLAREHQERLAQAAARRQRGIESRERRGRAHRRPQLVAARARLSTHA